nr:MAG TPA: hypothetical protein [Caudoviricetes sp.]
MFPAVFAIHYSPSFFLILPYIGFYWNRKPVIYWRTRSNLCFG